MMVVHPSATSQTWNSRHNKAVLLVSHGLAFILGFNVSFMVRVPTECPQFQLKQENLLHKANTTVLQTPERLIRATILPPSEQEKNISATQKSSTEPLIPSTMNKLFAGMGRVPRDDFFQTFDLGVPFMPSSNGNEEVLLLYGNENSLPYPRSKLSEAAIPFIPSANEATKRCMSMKLILTFTEDPYSCFAIMGQWESYIVHKWMRISKGRRATLDQPFKLVSRSQQRFDEALPFEFENLEDQGFSFLSKYASRLNEALQKLWPVVQPLVEGRKEPTIVLMMCNYGQSELFINFVCSARSRGLDTSQVLLYATDPDMEELGKLLGVATFYDEKLFGDLPIAASKEFLDSSFKRLMVAKVFVIHLIHKLKYNVLFQDVDVMWHRHPLEYFSSSHVGDFDMYFQDDGSRVFGEEPYYANGGFVFIRHNKRTTYFLSVLIRHADFIFAMEEQTLMNLLINEHMSLTGLRVKTLNRDDSLFLGGWHFHRCSELMKQLMIGKHEPYTFHISWTAHMTEKRQFLEQMGYYFVAEKCVSKSLREILAEGANHTVATKCCVAEPIPKCHYRDKPSRLTCNDSPPHQKEGPSFWSSKVA